MLQATKWALEQSIEKWEAIVKGTIGDLRGENCALCKRFANEHKHTKDKCPLFRNEENVCNGRCFDEWLSWAQHQGVYHGYDFRGMMVNSECGWCSYLAKEVLERLKKARRGAK